MKKIYLDIAATTAVDTNVIRAMNEYFRQDYFNPAAKYSDAEETFEVVEKTRKTIAEKIMAKSTEIIFTSGGTESNNLAIQGLARANPTKKHIIISKIEHPSVLEIALAFEKQDFEIDYVGVNAEGIVDIDEIAEKIREDTLVVSIMHVNNEIGTIQPIGKIGKICRENGIYFHTDAVQSFTKLSINVSNMNIDLLTASGHKINGPKGIGFLYVRDGVKISPLTFGGGQEKELRSGTLNVAGIVGLGKATEISKDYEKIKISRDLLVSKLLEIPQSRLNGSLESRISNNINISFKGIESEALLFKLDKAGILVSTGSACSSGKVDVSHVLEALGTNEDYIRGTVRFSFDELSRREIEYIVKNVKNSIEKLRELSPFIEVKNNRISKDMTFAELIEEDPDALSKLSEMGLGCGGCMMAQMETIEEGAMAHGLNPEIVLKELQTKKDGKQDGK